MQDENEMKTTKSNRKIWISDLAGHVVEDEEKILEGLLKK